MQDNKSDREFLVTILPHQSLSDRDRTLVERSAARRKYVRIEDTHTYSTKTPSIGGPAHFHEPTILWACERADLVLIEAGWLGPDSEIDFQTAVEHARFVLCIRTFPQRADVWARALRPFLRAEAPLYAAIMPVRITYDPPITDEFKDAFHLAYVGAR